MMTTRDFIKRRIQLKEQLIVLVRREIEALERELRDLEGEHDKTESPRENIFQEEL
jgi:hypothetical protein